MAKRAFLLLSVIAVAVTVAACGRATPAQIESALGITPSPTLSAADIAAATAAAATVASAGAADSSSSPGVGGATGDVALGARQFNTWCIGCHRAGGTPRGPDILSPGTAGTGLAGSALIALIRTGSTSHQPTYSTTELTDKQITDLAAHIRSLAGE